VYFESTTCQVRTGAVSSVSSVPVRSSSANSRIVISGKMNRK
jgi:hypothetical protein